MKNRLLCLMIFFALSGCVSNVDNIPERTFNSNSTCEITYSLTATGDYDLTREWKLIGLQQGYGPIHYPPCRGYEIRKNFEVTVSFSDTVHNLERSPYKYPYLFSGQGPVNYYSGSYLSALHIKGVPSDTLTIHGIVSTLMGGPAELNDYEKEFFDALGKGKRFEINNNILTIYYNAMDKLLFVAN